MLAAAAVSAGALAITGTLALPAGAATTRPAVTARPATASSLHQLTVRKIAFGARLRHSFVAGGVRHVEALAGPDDLGQLGAHLFVAFQNGIGPQGQASADGNTDSTIVEFTLSGAKVRQWDVRGKVDGLSADPFISSVIATVNEDGHSSLYTIRIPTGWVTHYAYSRPLPHLGGSDAISIFHGRIFISASAPGTGGTPPPHAPAVYVVSLHWQTRIASIRSLYSDDSVATLANGPHAGTKVRLALTDPDSSAIVPPVSPRFAGDFMLNSQGDQELIFYRQAGPHWGLQVLRLPTSVDDSAWATARLGALYITDASTDTLDIAFGPFHPGVLYTGVTPCDSGRAPATCPAPGFPANSLGAINLRTGAISAVATSDPTLNPAGMIFVP